MEELIRTEWLLGEEAMRKLQQARVAVFGLGGVGSYTAEALARGGIGALELTDQDVVDRSNLNRQLIALQSTIGQKKTEACRQRLLDIIPGITVHTYSWRYDQETAEQYPYEEYDYIVDAIDTVSSKLLLIEKAEQYRIPVISCMGVGNKLHPELLRITDITKTSVCPLARVMRRELKKRGIPHCQVLFSEEEPLVPAGGSLPEGRKRIPGSISFVPSVAGLMLAGEVIRQLSSGV